MTAASNDALPESQDSLIVSLRSRVPGADEASEFLLHDRLADAESAIPAQNEEANDLSDEPSDLIQPQIAPCAKSVGVRKPAPELGCAPVHTSGGPGGDM